MILQKIIDTSDRYDRSIDTIYYYYDPPIILSSPLLSFLVAKVGAMPLNRSCAPIGVEKN